MKRTLSKDLLSLSGQNVLIEGWVKKRKMEWL